MKMTPFAAIESRSNLCDLFLPLLASQWLISMEDRHADHDVSLHQQQQQLL